MAILCAILISRTRLLLFLDGRGITLIYRQSHIFLEKEKSSADGC